MEKLIGGHTGGYVARALGSVAALEDDNKKSPKKRSKEEKKE
jgi:hypothetical protein